jgi:hypothetical protein
MGHRQSSDKGKTLTADSPDKNITLIPLYSGLLQLPVARLAADDDVGTLESKMPMSLQFLDMM